MSNPPLATMQLTVVNPSTSGATNDQVYVCLLGTDPATKQFGYLNLAVSPPVMVTGTTFTYQPGISSQTLAQIEKTMGGHTIPVPPMKSARIYFAIGADFDASQMPSSGPTASKTNPALFDKIEFDTASPGWYNINPTSVDFYGLSFTVTATPSGTSSSTTVGYAESRQSIIDKLWKIPVSPDDQHSGNTRIFHDSFVTVPGGTGQQPKVLRVLSPKSMALTDWGSITDTKRATQCSHFLDDYVNNHVFAANRQFTFYTKDYEAPTTKNPHPNNAPKQVWATVSGDGKSMNLYTDEGRTQPYAVPTLSRPSATWPNPPFTTPSNYHNTTGTSADQIDWGFLLIGNVAAAAGSVGAAWGTDPAAMAIMVSICRGVAHMDNGTTSWVDPAQYYKGDGSGKSTQGMPILYFSSVLHQAGVNGLAYVLSYDDVYGRNPSITFADGGAVTITLNDVGAASIPAAATA